MFMRFLNPFYRHFANFKINPCQLGVLPCNSLATIYILFKDGSCSSKTVIKWKSDLSLLIDNAGMIIVFILIFFNTLSLL